MRTIASYGYPNTLGKLILRRIYLAAGMNKNKSAIVIITVIPGVIVVLLTYTLTTDTSPRKCIFRGGLIDDERARLMYITLDH